MKSRKSEMQEIPYDLYAIWITSSFVENIDAIYFLKKNKLNPKITAKNEETLIIKDDCAFASKPFFYPIS